MQRKTSPDGQASVLLNKADLRALARTADFFFLRSDCCRGNGDMEGRIENERRGQAVQAELQRLAKLDKSEAVDD